MTQGTDIGLKAPQHAFFADPNLDRLYAMVLGLAAELSALNDTLDTIRRLIDRKGVVTRAEIDGFMPSAADEAERDARRRLLVESLLAPLDTEARDLLAASLTNPPS